MQNDRLWIHWTVLAVSGAFAILAAIVAPEMPWLRVGMGAFGAILVGIAISGWFGIGSGASWDREEAELDRHSGESDEDRIARKLRRAGKKARTEEAEEEGG